MIMEKTGLSTDDSMRVASITILALRNLEILSSIVLQTDAVSMLVCRIP